METKSKTSNIEVVPQQTLSRVRDSEPARPGEGMPSRLGRYVVLQEIGRGGMGVVWTAYDPKLDRKVAIKLLKSSSRTSVRQARFIREAQALARLNHPNIVTVHDVDTHEGRLYMAMEYVPGQTFEAWSSQRRSWREIIAVLVEAGQGLAAAHAAGITHRDFKPSNVLIADDGRVKVLDFGLAKHIQRAAGDGDENEGARSGPDVVSLEESRSDERDSNIMEMIGSARGKLTKLGRFVGTPAYMAPEQFTLVDRHEIGAWTDQFGFAVTLYEALYGELPFEGNDLYDTYDNARAGHIREPGRDSSVPGWVFRVLQRARHYEPERRYPSMPALLDALRADPARRRRRRLAYVGGAGLLGLLALGITWAATREQPVPCQGARDRLLDVWDETTRSAVQEGLAAVDRPFAADTARRVTVSLDRYAEAWVEQHTSICRATRIHGQQSEALLDVRMTCLDRRLSELGALARVLAVPGEDTIAVAMAAAADLRRPEPCAAAQPGVESERPAEPERLAEFVALQAQLDDAEALLVAGRHLEARDRAATAAKSARDSEFRRLLARAQVIEGAASREVDELDDAEQRLREGITLASEVADFRTELRGWSNLLFIAGVMRDQPERAADWQFAAEGALRRAGSPQDLEFSLALTTGGVLLEQGRLQEATEVGERALRIAEQYRGTDSLHHARALTNLGIVAAKRAHWPLAERRLRQAYELTRELLGPEHPEVASNGLNLANVLVQAVKGREDSGEVEATYDEAERLYREVVTFRERNDGPSSKSVAQSLIMLGVLQANRSKLREARDTYQRVLNLLRSLPEAQDNLATALTNLANVERQSGKLERAEAYYHEALDLQIAQYGPSHPRVGTIRLHLCQLLDGAQRHQDAIDQCEQALTVFEAHDEDSTRPLRVSAHRFLERSNEQLGRAANASEHRAAALQAQLDAAKQP